MNKRLYGPQMANNGLKWCLYVLSWQETKLWWLIITAHFNELIKTMNISDTHFGVYLSACFWKLTAELFVLTMSRAILWSGVDRGEIFLPPDPMRYE